MCGLMIDRRKTNRRSFVELGTKCEVYHYTCAGLHMYTNPDPMRLRPPIIPPNDETKITGSLHLWGTLPNQSLSYMKYLITHITSPSTLLDNYFF